MARPLHSANCSHVDQSNRMRTALVSGIPSASSSLPSRHPFGPAGSAESGMGLAQSESPSWSSCSALVRSTYAYTPGATGNGIRNTPEKVTEDDYLISQVTDALA